MLLAVAGLKPEEVKALTKKLADRGLVRLPQAERAAFGLAYKLSTRARRGHRRGPRRRWSRCSAASGPTDLIWYISWCNYMTRFADAFQLPLERTTSLPRRRRTRRKRRRKRRRKGRPRSGRSTRADDSESVGRFFKPAGRFRFGLCRFVKQDPPGSVILTDRGPPATSFAPARSVPMRRYLTRLTGFFKGLSPSGQRRAFGFGVLGVGVLLGYYYFFSDGLPILWGPTARASDIAAGRELFEHEWQPNDPLAHGDGLGPVFNAQSCAACHFQGGLGGGGGNEHNAVSFEVFAAPRRPELHHRHHPQLQRRQGSPGEHEASSGSSTPSIKGRTIPPQPRKLLGPHRDPRLRPGPHADRADHRALRRGWIDLISDRAILRNARNRGMREAVNELKGEFAAVPVGRVRHVARRRRQVRLEGAVRRPRRVRRRGVRQRTRPRHAHDRAGQAAHCSGPGR